MFFHQLKVQHSGTVVDATRGVTWVVFTKVQGKARFSNEQSLGASSIGRYFNLKSGSESFAATGTEPGHVFCQKLPPYLGKYASIFNHSCTKIFSQLCMPSVVFDIHRVHTQ